VTPLLVLADFLGAPPTCMRVFGPTGHVSRIRHVESVHPGMARAMHEEALYRTGCPAQVTLRRVRRDRGHDVDTNVEIPWSTPGFFFWDGAERASITYADEADMHVPAFAREWLLAHRGRLVMAGGAALAAVAKSIQATDYDFFIVGATPAEASAILADLTARPDVEVAMQTAHAVTMLVDQTYKAQVVLRLYDSREHLLTSFDLQPCKILVQAHYDSNVQSRDLAAWATPSWFLSMDCGTLFVELSAWGAASFARILKYCMRGFNVFIPCSDARFLRRDVASTSEPLVGIAQLYHFKQTYLQQGRITMYALSRALTHPAYRASLRSGYEESMGMRGVLIYWLQAWVRRLTASRTAFDVGDVRWAPAGRSGCNFYPRKACWSRAFDVALWAEAQVARVTDAAHLRFTLLHGRAFDEEPEVDV
jgi:hypothetical protein